MKKLILLVLLALLVVPFRALADEGMWLLPLLKKNNEAAMKKLGLQIPVEEIIGDPDGSLSQAVVSFGGGCTASFISSEGLLLTNYHCSYGAIQQHSSMEHNLVENGFWALARGEELPVSGLSVVMNKNIVDVSDEVNTRLDAIGRNAENMYKVSAEISAQHVMRGLKNVVKSYKNGTIHILYQQQVFEDVRLVGVPPKAVAKFGGETDNWMWPRHSVDFAYFRVYTSDDGRPNKYSRNNVPYRPDEYLRVSSEGYAEGDFAMSIGYPGNNNRQATSARVREVAEVYNVAKIDVRGVRMDVLKRHMNADPAIALKYSEKYSTAANYLKNAHGMNEWTERLGVVESKRTLENDLVEWIGRDAGLRAKYPDVEAYLSSQDSYDLRYGIASAYFREAFNENCEMLNFAGAFGGWMYSAIFNPGGGAGDIPSFVSTARGHYKDYDKDVDAAVTKATLRLLREKFPAELLPSFYTDIDRDFGGDTDAYVDMLYEKSIFAELDRIVGWTEKQDRDYDSDPVVLLLASVDKKREEFNRLSSPNRGNGGRGGADQYFRALIEYKGGSYYPNADGTIRLSYGTVQNLTYDGNRYNFQTYLGELIAKEDLANSDYYVHPGLRKLWESNDFGGYGTGGDMPMCFITDGDVTGGNSGSPMLNGKGELIGLVFDCNWESMTRDYNYNPGMNRAICVDARYILLITEKFSASDIIISEITGIL